MMNNAMPHCNVSPLRALGLITARGGSKGLPRKNILPFCGKPLIAWTIEAALQSGVITDCIVSSDDAEILDTSKKWGAQTPFVRPAELATDDSTSVDVALHAIDWLERQCEKTYDVLVLLQPTSPLRLASDIADAFARFQESGAPSCVSVCRHDHPVQWTYTLTRDTVLAPFFEDASGMRRQALPPTYYSNGAVFIVNICTFKSSRKFFLPEGIGFVMPKERSLEIDDATDFYLAESLWMMSGPNEKKQ